ncbi:MAG: OmpA family protein [Candidatus Goldbacteria bacterium]|nr:OmpA family protein [Candidatus Goldiibacteriota bacterium]
MNKKLNFLIVYFIILFFILFFSLISIGCKKKRVPPTPTPTPTNTPIPSIEKIVYTYNGNLYWINIDGSGKEILFPDNNSKWFPSVSPSGWYIAYWVQKNSFYNLWLADLKSSKTTQLTFDQDKLEGDIQNFKINNSPAWSFDESFILYSRNKNIWKITRDGFNQESITFSHDCISPSISKENKIVYVKIESPETHNLYIRDLGLQNEEKLTNYINKKVVSPCISADGKKVVFALNYGQNIDLILLDINKKTTEQLSFDGKSLSPKFSYDSEKIVYTNFVNDKYQPEIWIMKIDKTDRIKITEDGGHSPCWLYRILSEPLPSTEKIIEPEIKKIEEPIIIETQPVQETLIQPTPQISQQYTEDILTVKIIKQDNNLLFYPVIHFDSGNANIKREFYKVLDDIFIIIKKYESPIIIHGHTDNMPIHTKKYPSNYELSLDRANKVKKYFIKKGINSNRISTKGFADTQPLLPNDTPENMYKNRRAEILLKIIKSEEGKILNELITPTSENIELPTPEPTFTPTPTPKPKNIFEKFFKKTTRKSKITSW